MRRHEPALTFVEREPFQTEVPLKREIIVGYEPHFAGEDVLRLGRVLCEVLAAAPRVVTAIPWPDYLSSIAELDRELETETRAKFESIEESMRDLDVTTLAIASRTPSQALQEIAESDRAILIVVGSSHRGMIGRTLAGSVGESLLHGASCAVAIAPRGYAKRPQDHLQRIGVAFDGSPESWTALETGIGLAERSHAAVSAIAVADYPKYGYATAWSILSTGEFRDAEVTDKERLLELARGRIPKTIDVDSRVLTGDPGAELGHVSGEFDLLIAGSRSWGPLKRTLLGSTTRKLIRSSACPVLVLPRGAGVDPLGVRVNRDAADAVA